MPFTCTHSKHIQKELCFTHQWNIFLYVGTVRKIGEYRIHVLDVCNGDSQIGKPRQGSSFILILGITKEILIRLTALDWVILLLTYAGNFWCELTVALTVSW